MQPLLAIQNLSAGYGGKAVIRNISLELKPGEILGIAGESGSGKTTLLKALSDIKGLHADIYQGEVAFDGKDLLRMGKKEKRGLWGEDIVCIFQHPGDSLNPTRKVRSQFYETILAHRHMEKGEMDSLIASVFQRIGLGDVERILDAYPFALSGGMAQRVVIALAVVLRPKLILADYPTSALDTTVQKQVLEELLMLRETLHTAMIVITHNIGVVRCIADRVAVLYEGEIVETGDTKQVLDYPRHLYTKMLMAAVPNLAYAEERKKYGTCSDL